MDRCSLQPRTAGWAKPKAESDSVSDPVWEYAPLRIPSDVTGINAAVRLALHAEYGGWELARVRKYGDGTRQILLRRKRRPAEAVPMPGLID